MGSSNIETIQVGDLVKSVIPHTGETVARRVLKVAYHSRQKIWKIRFEDGTEIRTTSTHSFRVGDKWIQASKIKSRDAIFADIEAIRTRSKIVIESGETSEVTDVFNLIVEGENNFIADHVLVSSFTHLRMVRGFLWNCVGFVRRFNNHTPVMEVA